MERIGNAPTFRSALLVAASHLSELLDEMISIMEPDGLLETQYRVFSNLRRRDFESDGYEFSEEYIFMWESAERIMGMYDRAPVMTDLELELESESLFAPDWDLEIEKEEAIRNLFGNVLAYLKGMKDTELRDKTPRVLRQMTFHGPGFDLESYLPYHWSWYVPPERDLESWEEAR